MNTLHVVARHDVLYNHANPCTGNGQSRIKIPLLGVLPEPLGMLAPHMLGANLRRVRFRQIHPIGVEPHMHFHVACVRLLNSPLQRVPNERCTLLSCQPMTCRLKLAVIQRISRRPHLENNGIDSQTLQRIQLKQHLRLLFRRVSYGLRRWPINISHGCNPCPAKTDLRFQCTKGQCTKYNGYYVTQFDHSLHGIFWHFHLDEGSPSGAGGRCR